MKDPLERHRAPFDGRFAMRDFPTAPPRGTPSAKSLEDELDALVERLDALQRRFHADGRHALLAVFQGLDTSGKDGTIRSVFSGVNPAGLRVHAFGPPSALERRRDFLARAAERVPERGMIGVFNRSHYEEVLVVRVRRELLAAQRLPDAGGRLFWEGRYESIRCFEEHLARNGTVILKFWLHVSREEQKRRLLSRIDDPDKNWKFRLEDLDDRARWHEFMGASEAMLRATSRAFAPWYVVPADDKDYFRVAVARVLVGTLENIDPRYPRLGAKERRALEQGRRRLRKE